MSTKPQYYVRGKVGAAEQVDALTRQFLRDKVALLNETSRARFYEIWSHPFPDGDPITQMSVKQLHVSIGLVDRTLEAAERAKAAIEQQEGTP